MHGISATRLTPPVNPFTVNQRFELNGDMQQKYSFGLTQTSSGVFILDTSSVFKRLKSCQLAKFSIEEKLKSGADPQYSRCLKSSVLLRLANLPFVSVTAKLIVFPVYNAGSKYSTWLNLLSCQLYAVLGDMLCPSSVIDAMLSTALLTVHTQFIDSTYDPTSQMLGLIENDPISIQL